MDQSETPGGCLSTWGLSMRRLCAAAAAAFGAGDCLQPQVEQAAAEQERKVYGLSPPRRRAVTDRAGAEELYVPRGTGVTTREGKTVHFSSFSS
jgi:hypothetical protein